MTTHSSGNHGIGLCYAASQLKINAYIVVPEIAPKIKKQAVESFENATIFYCKDATVKSREAKV